MQMDLGGICKQSATSSTESEQQVECEREIEGRARRRLDVSEALQE